MHGQGCRISSFPKQPHAMKVREFTKRTRVHKSLTPKHQGYSRHHPTNFEKIPWFHMISTYKYWNPWLTSPKQTQHRKRIHSQKVSRIFITFQPPCVVFFRTGLQTHIFVGGRVTILSPISPGISNWRQTIRAVALLRSGSRWPRGKKRLSYRHLKWKEWMNHQNNQHLLKDQVFQPMICLQSFIYTYVCEI